MYGKKQRNILFNVRNFNCVSPTMWKNDGVIPLLEDFGHPSDPHDTLAESFFLYSTIKEANEALAITLTANVASRLGDTISEHEK